MTRPERWREPISEIPGSDVLKAKHAEGWRPVAIEWERVSKEGDASAPAKRPIPYGLRISADCRHLEIDPVEREVMGIIVAMIAGDHPLSKVAEELAGRGHRTRDGAAWTQVALFRLLPRIVEIGPEILSQEQWSQSKKSVLAAVG